jgi:hypothetical protein
LILGGAPKEARLVQVRFPVGSRGSRDGLASRRWMLRGQSDSSLIDRLPLSAAMVYFDEGAAWSIGHEKWSRTMGRCARYELGRPFHKDG